MSINEMQACLARLYVDEPFRKLFCIDPIGVLKGYHLTQEESATLRGLDRDLLEQFAESLIAKRRKRIERAYPLLFRLNGAEIRRYYTRYYQLYTAKPYQFDHQEVIDFGRFIEESLVNAEHLPLYASDLARYERLYYWTAMVTASDSDRVAAGKEAASLNIASLDARPVLRLDVTVADFSYDVGTIEEALQSGHALKDVHAGSGCTIIFRPGISTSRVQMLRINGPTKTILDSCDGHHTVAQIVADTEAALGACDLRDPIIESINRLLASHVLSLDGAGQAYLRIEDPQYTSATQIESM